MSKPPGLLLFDDFFAVAEELTGDEYKAVILALRAYQQTGAEPTFDDRTMRGVFRIGKKAVDENSTSYGRKVTQCSEAGKASAEARRAKMNEMNDRSKIERTLTKRTNQNENGTQNGIQNGGKPLTPRNPPENKRSVMYLQKTFPRPFDLWQAVRAVYPSAMRRSPTGGVLQIIEEKQLYLRKDEIVATVKRFRAEDDQWRRGYIPAMSRFFEEERYENEPTPPKSPETVHRVYTSQAPEMDDIEGPQDLPVSH